MKVVGFSLIRNGVLYGYPFKEAILSILPLCDEFIVNAGDSEDETLDVLQSIKDSKIKIFTSKWDVNLKNSGSLLSVETNKALDKCSGDWLFYLQADEVLHEKYIPAVKDAMQEYLDDKQIEGLNFFYKHFYGTYDYYQDNYRKWYIKTVRIIRKNDNIVSWGDAVDFRHKDGSKLKTKSIKAEIYHYGWVRPPEKHLNKRINFEKLYRPDEEVERIKDSLSRYEHLGDLKEFKETHPAVMKERVEESKWEFDPQLERQSPDWIRAIKIFFSPITKRIYKLVIKK